MRRLGELLFREGLYRHPVSQTIHAPHDEPLPGGKTGKNLYPALDKTPGLYLTLFHFSGIWLIDKKGGRVFLALDGLWGHFNIRFFHWHKKITRAAMPGRIAKAFCSSCTVTGKAVVGPECTPISVTVAA